MVSIVHNLQPISGHRDMILMAYRNDPTGSHLYIGQILLQTETLPTAHKSNSSKDPKLKSSYGLTMNLLDL